jgi:hypothetical protein
MSSERRSFLKRLGLGCLGVAGMLLPSRVLAGFRRGGGHCYPAVSECPGIQVSLVPGPVNINYPPATSPLTIVPGNGYFFTWGTMADGVTITGASVSWDGLLIPIPGTAVPVQQPTTQWAYRFMLPPPPPPGPITLTVTGMSGTQPVQSQVVFLIGAY